MPTPCDLSWMRLRAISDLDKTPIAMSFVPYPSFEAEA